MRRNAAGSGSHLAGFVLLRDVVDALEELLRDGRARFEPGHAELLGFLGNERVAEVLPGHEVTAVGVV